jgi:hypothetical protein
VPEDRVIIVHLRRPGTSDMRSDPFWEFGSFGITGCHSNNLMAPRNAAKLKGVRLAFAQGGREGTKLVYLSPPVEIVAHADRLEAKWPHEKPFRYDEAPILVSNRALSDFSQLDDSLKGARKTREAQFSSCFRSKTTCLEVHLAKEIIKVYTRLRNRAPASAFASCYSDALPFQQAVDTHRQQTYREKLKEVRESETGNGCGGPMRPKSYSLSKRPPRRC